MIERAQFRVHVAANASGFQRRHDLGVEGDFFTLTFCYYCF